MTDRKAEKRQRLATRNALIRKDYEALYKKGLRSEVVFKNLTDKYFLGIHALESIVFKKGTYAEY